MDDGVELVVAAGPDLGARAPLGDAPLIVGRGRDTDLRLTDLSVSRRHLELRATASGVEVRVLPGASPLTLGGAKTDQATLALGDRMHIGNTVLCAVMRRAAASEATTCELTAVRSLWSAEAVEARGLGAIFELSERLDRAAGESELLGIVAAWAAQHVRAEAVRLVPAAPESEAPADHIIERAAGGAVEIVVPLVGLGDEALALRIAGAAGRTSAELRRLLAVAARVVASGLVRLRALSRAETQKTDLRRLAIGSATSFLGSTPAAERVAHVLGRLARADSCALLFGETGVGKTFLARLIHENGPRAREPFRVVNCAAIPDGLLESELFGHERGAFTGAVASREGALEAAGRGTILLDEIGDLPLASQAKLLRALEERRFERVGSTRTLEVHARILCATNRELKQMASAGAFRSDLFYRVSAVTVTVPALRERAADIPLLLETFLADLAPSLGRRVTGFSSEAVAALVAHDWPGNVRELRNVVEHALVLGDGPVVSLGDLPPEIAGAAALGPERADPDTVRLPLDLATLEERAIDAALRASGGNRARAAALLGINRVTLYKKLKERP